MSCTPGLEQLLRITFKGEDHFSFLLRSVHLPVCVAVLIYKILLSVGLKKFLMISVCLISQYSEFKLFTPLKCFQKCTQDYFSLQLGSTESFPYSALQTAVLTLLSGDTSLSSKNAHRRGCSKKAHCSKAESARGFLVPALRTGNELSSLLVWAPHTQYLKPPQVCMVQSPPCASTLAYPKLQLTVHYISSYRRYYFKMSNQLPHCPSSHQDQGIISPRRLCHRM